MANGKGVAGGVGATAGKVAVKGVSLAAGATHRDGSKSAVQVAMDRDVRPWLDLVDNLRALGIEQVRARGGEGGMEGGGQGVRHRDVGRACYCR